MSATTTAVSTVANSRARAWTGWVWKSVLVLTLVVAGLWTATHGVAGATWGQVLTVLRDLRLRQVVTLAAIWFAGLAVYATVLAAALPGLGVRRGLLLNLSGSAVANLIPFGGAVATGLNWRMVRTWGHSNGAFTTFCVLTNVLDVAMKLVLPMVAVIALALAAAHVPLALWMIACGCAVVLVTAAGVVQGVASRHGVHDADVATSTDDGGDSRLRRVLVPLGRLALRVRQLLLEQWSRLLPASLVYVAAQVALLDVSLRAVGLPAPLSVVLMAAAIERLSSLVPLTPGGAGFAEVGTIAWLVANGLDPVESVAGVLVYRFFLIAMEVPVGGMLLGTWAWSQRSPLHSPGPAT